MGKPISASQPANALLPVAKAKELIKNSLQPLSPVQLPLLEAACHILAADVVATINIPAYPQSSMDGYAIRFAEKDVLLQISGEMAAGTATPLQLLPRTATRIFTGAPLPDGADTVVMQEKVSLTLGMLKINDEALIEGMNVRAAGAEAAAGKVAVQKGTVLSPAAIGFLAGIGCTEVPVYPVPSVSIIVTGRELQQPGLPLAFGQVYESNSYSLRAALGKAGVKYIKVFEADDDLTTLQDILAKALERSDMVLLTGGVSVGAYDFVPEAARLCGVQTVFHKVAQKPGKPLYYGLREDKPVFGLPGNPASVLSCYYNYVLPAIEQLSCRRPGVQQQAAVLKTGVAKPHGLTQFLKAQYHNGEVIPLGAQESFRLSSFAEANCLAELEAGVTQYHAGDKVIVHLLPY